MAKLTKPYQPNFFGEARALASVGRGRCPSIRVVGIADGASVQQCEALADLIDKHFPGDQMDAMIKQDYMDGAIVRLSGRDYAVVGNLIICIRGRGNGH